MTSNEKEKILLITDSLGMVRSIPEQVTDDETWTYRVIDHVAGKHNVRMFRHRGLDTTALIYHLKHSISAYQQVDTLILQVGVVDCYPRTLSHNTQARIKKLPLFLQRYIFKVVKKHHEFFIQLSDNRYVKPVRFAENLRLIKEHFKGVRLLVIPIAPACEIYNNGNSKVAQSIETYNQILTEIFRDEILTDTYKCEDINTLFLLDGHHLSVDGHQLVFDSIVDALSQ